MDNKGKRKGLEALTLAGSSLKETSEKIKEQKQEFSTENNIIFSFFIDKNLILYIKELVFIKINESDDNYFYNESIAIREGVQLLKEAFPDIPQRPHTISNPTKSGRGAKSDPYVVKVRTSFTISEADREFIYDFIYNKQKKGGRYTKEEFLTLLVEHLENKYKLKKK